MDTRTPDVAAGTTATTDGCRATGHARLRVETAGRWFDPPSGRRADTRRRESLRALLRALGAARLATPGVPVAAEALIAAAWPGERILPAAARNRLYVAITTLRGMGLHAVLRSSDAGYFLDPGVPFEWCPG